MLKTAIANWKTTASGFLTFIGLTSGVLIPFVHQQKALIALTISSALATAYIGAISRDAGKQEAFVPGQGIKTVDSHEMPDDKNDRPVTKN